MYFNILDKFSSGKKYYTNKMRNRNRKRAQHTFKMMEKEKIQYNFYCESRNIIVNDLQFG